MLLALSALLACVATLGPKVVYYGRQAGDERSAQEEAVQRLLVARGWSPVGTLWLTLDGGIHAQRYLAPGCAGEIRVAVLSPSGQDDALASGMAGAGDRLRFAYRGKVSDRPPRGAAWREKWGRLVASLRLTAASGSPVLAMAMPAACGEADFSWLP